MTHAGLLELWESECGGQDGETHGPTPPSSVWNEHNNALLWPANADEALHPGDAMFLELLGPDVTQSYRLAPNTSSVNQSVAEWPGDFGFSAVIAGPARAGKNVTWTYSEELRKLYVTMNSPCPIRCITERAPPDGSFVCVVAVFKESDSRQENVLRCPAHCMAADALRIGALKGQWFDCDHPEAQYCCDNANGGRHCIRLPLGSDVFHLTFGCRNSCAGGPSRRATEIVFLLQSPEGQDLARSVVQVKVCACPGRDRRRDEEGREHERAVPPTQAAFPSTSMLRDVGTDGSSSDSGGESRGGTLTLRVKDREVHRVLTHFLENAQALSVPDLRTRRDPSSESDD
ncbi:cellular tumor antigen p53-like [Amblyomma americanum]